MDLFFSDPFPKQYSDYFLESCSPVSDDTKPWIIINNDGVEDQHHVLQLASKTPKRKAGRIKFRETRHPVYRGIRKRNGGKWVCEMREPKKKSRIWLGTFPTAEMAARAHDVAAIALKGKSACLNFADSAWRLPIPASSNAKDIQRAAAEAAQAFRPSSEENTQEQEERPLVVTPRRPKDEGCMATTSLWENGSSSSIYMDDDVLFDMPRIMSEMAEALMLPLPPPPPSSQCLLEGSYGDVDMSDSLWSYFLH